MGAKQFWVLRNLIIQSMHCVRNGKFSLHITICVWLPLFIMLMNYYKKKKKYLNNAEHWTLHMMIIFNFLVYALCKAASVNEQFIFNFQPLIRYRSSIRMFSFSVSLTFLCRIYDVCVCVCVFARCFYRKLSNASNYKLNIGLIMISHANEMKTLNSNGTFELRVVQNTKCTNSLFWYMQFSIQLPAA